MSLNMALGPTNIDYWDCRSDATSNIWSSSEESDDEDETKPWKRLLKDLSDFYLDSLHAIFKESCYTSNHKRKPEDQGLTKGEFVEAINEVFGNEKHVTHALLLFNEATKNGGKSITWDQFLNFALSQGDAVLSPNLKLCAPKLYTVPHAQRETISKIVLIETDKHFCYAIISKYGRVGLYDGNMNFLTSYHVIMGREDIMRTDQERRRRNRWVTDAFFMQDIFMFAVTNSTRSLIIYDASGLKHIPLWLILGIPYVINSLAYNGNSSHGKCVLYLGDELGCITSLNFIQPKASLFRKKHNDKINLFYWRELPEEKDFVVVKNHRKAHKESIVAMEYIQNNGVLISCSRDGETSVIIRQTSSKRPPVVFKMIKGTTCFSYNKKLLALITGTDDGIVRVWNCTMPNKALAILSSHVNGIVDIVILETVKLFLSISRDGVLCLWDMKEYNRLQTIKIKYPPFKILGRGIEWGKKCIFPGPKRQSIQPEANEDFEKVSIDNDLEVNKIPSEGSSRNDTKIISEDIWKRSYLLVTCCNFIAQIDLSYYDIETAQLFESPVLQPPPLQNSVLVPATWNLCNRDTNKDTESTEIDEKLEDYIKSLSFILDKDLLAENDKKNNINYRIALLEREKLQMQGVVSQCAPFLALRLHPIEEIKINPDLVVPNKKNIKSLVDKTNRMLSSAASRSLIFSSSSSKSRSTRSSIVDFEM